MPKIVDPVARRRAVAQAVLSVAARQGLEHASLRNVADEARLAIGSVRHYFADHDELMTFTMRELSRRIGDRIRIHAERLLTPDGSTDRRAGTEELLAEFLPLDEARRQESALWLAFTAAAHTRPQLRPCAAEMQADLHTLMTRVLHEARRAGGLPGNMDIELESTRLAALLDGLTLQATLLPDRYPSKLLRQVLRRHLDALRAGS
ncbi:TetR family transcriptional regulator C-terminal domain-containing protein [Streptomyces yunnanensis]|uniref:TetR family transcriptional regulator C-terminal domain-containing protein n=1 Tax=Streptomyces yunnanensis TaxID=156453 RepID=A0ABY8AFI8_9ACTN|nr:TetR family transcriptional regulator C-terminal domain-containing protein [Streptomyces yunnanensis]WEB43593.1 TetR family transcriptional regulator C-terminal domain-containing protein [Streptomyces yunnanensis]